ncbi:MAG TPA: hypothetical protein VGE59_01800 [Patescibacteria group bacterium]
MNNVILGYSTAFYDPSTYGINQRIQEICEIQTNAIELVPNDDGRFTELLTQESVELVRACHYRSIHAPALLEYSQDLVVSLLDLARDINAQVIVFHPDKTQDFQKLHNQFGSLIAIENMDRSKTFGNTVRDLEEVFKKIPNAYWVADVNHLYSLDTSLRLNREMHDAFSNRLHHYHVSGYGGLHSCLSLTHEVAILDAVQDLSKPLIHEGGIMVKHLLKHEDEYVKNYLLRI